MSRGFSVGDEVVTLDECDRVVDRGVVAGDSDPYDTVVQWSDCSDPEPHPTIDLWIASEVSQ